MAKTETKPIDEPPGMAEKDWVKAEREYTDEVIEETTLPRLFEDSAERYLEKEAQMFKGGIYDRTLPSTAIDDPDYGEYGSITYEQMRDIVRNLATGFRRLGVKNGLRIGMFSTTRMEWAQADFALLANGGIVTTVYPTSSTDQTKYLLKDPDAKGVVVENQELLEKVLEVEDELDLRFIVVIDYVSPEYLDRKDIFTLGEVYQYGKENFDLNEYQSWIDSIDYEDIATLIYTSGTTGQPKGVILTHKNLRSNVNSIRKRFGPRPDKENKDFVLDHTKRTLSFLPLAHAFERLAGHFYPMGTGMTVAYAENPDTVSEDLQKVKPHGATSVPRVYERIYHQIQEEADESSVKKKAINWAINVGMQYNKTDSPGFTLKLKRKIADRLVYSSIKDELGGNVIGFISGGGTLPVELAELYEAINLPIFEGYGLTEASPVVTATPTEDVRIGYVGPALPDVDVRLDESKVPETKQRRADGKVGELQVRGPNVSQGYWKKPDETEESFEDGWFKTGDIMEMDEDGFLKFHDRSKHMIVLSTGRNVAPEPIEDRFTTSSVVDQCMVMGDDRKYVSALIVPDFVGLRNWAKEEGITLPDTRLPLGRNMICHSEQVVNRIQDEVDKINEDLEDYQKIRNFTLLPEGFTQENKLITPTLKKKREKIGEKYRHRIETMYGES